MNGYTAKQWDHAIRHDKRRVGWWYLAVFVVAMGCLVYWGNGNNLTVEVPVQDGVTVQRLFTERDMYKSLYLKTMEDYRKRSAITESMLKASNMEIAKLKGQLAGGRTRSPTI